MQIYETTMTSESHPMSIDEISVPGMNGKIGITLCPGKKGPSIEFCLDWDRDLDSDLDVVSSWGAKAILTLIEDHEFEMLGVQALPKKVSSRGITWFHLPIEDGAIPDSRFTKKWLEISEQLLQMLQNGENIIIHCRGGYGRAGMVAALLLLEVGMNAESAIDSVRVARPGTMETFEQEEYVRTFTPFWIKTTA